MRAKRVLSLVLAIAMVLSLGLVTVTASADEATSPVRKMEYLDRGLVAMKVSTGVYLSWRFLGDDPDDVSFNLYRDGALIATVTDSSNYSDPTGTTASVYEVAAVIGGVESAHEGTLVPMLAQNGTNNGNFFDIDLQRPAAVPVIQFRNPRGDLYNATGRYYYMPLAKAEMDKMKQAILDFEAGTITQAEYDAAEAALKAYTDELGLDAGGGAGPTLRQLGYTGQKVPLAIENGVLKYGMSSAYNPNDMTVGDLDGDGQYEVVVKWDAGGQDSMISYKATAPCIIDAYELDGTFMWRVDVGYNIRSGAHDTQMQLYDFNGDGKSELILRTADGTTSGTLVDGKYVPTSFVGPEEAAYVADYLKNNQPELVNRYITNIMNNSSIVWEDPVYGTTSSSNGWGEDNYISTGSYSGQVANQFWCKVYSYGPAGGPGNEYVTAFDGATGAILDTVDYVYDVKEDQWGINNTCRRGAPVGGSVTTNGEGWWNDYIDYVGNRYMSGGDTTGNRACRYLGGVALLDGETPSALICRGYYARTTIAAYNLTADNELVLDSTFDSAEYGEDHWKYEGRGNHNLAVGDVDNDGCDEIIYGSISFKKKNLDSDKIDCMYVVGAYQPIGVTPTADIDLLSYLSQWVNEDGSGKDGTIFGYNHHGDAIHLLPMDTSNTLILMTPHESQGSLATGLGAGSSAHIAATGKFTMYTYRSGDIGRGAAGNVDPRTPDQAKVWASHYYNGVTGAKIGNIPSNLPSNSLVYWDGDLLREGFDGGDAAAMTVRDMAANGTVSTIFTTTGAISNNSTKANAGITCDLFGDWREEIIMRTSDNAHLRVFTTNMPTTFKIRTLMHDPMYRLQVSSQNTTYNQPPNPSFFMGYTDSTLATPIIATAKRTDIALETRVNKNLLKAAIDLAEGLDSREYVDFSVIVADLAIANEVYADPAATGAEVEHARQELLAAIDQLVLKSVKDALRAAIAEAEALNPYLYDNFFLINAPLNAALAVEANFDATQKQVDDATAALEAAIAKLISKVELRGAIADAKAIDASIHTPALQEALAAAIAVEADAAATQVEIDAATAALKAAVRSILLFEDFEEHTAAELPWTTQTGADTNAAAGMAQAIVEYGSSGLAGRYQGSGSGGRGMQLNLNSPVAYETVVVEADWFATQGSRSGQTPYLRFSIQDGKSAVFSSSVRDNQFITFIGMGGKLYAYLGNWADGAALPAGAIQLVADNAQNKWYHINVELNFTASTLSYALTDLNGNAVASGENLPFASGVTYNAKVESLRFYHQRTDGTLSTYLDNVYIGPKTELAEHEIDKTALQAAIAEAEALNESKYLVDSWADLEAALALAKTVDADENAEQGTIDAATASLKGAIAALKLKATTVTVKNALVSVKKGKTFQIVLTSDLYDKNAVAYTALNPLVATVSNTGLITGVKSGSTMILVRTTDGSNITKSITVNVTN